MIGRYLTYLGEVILTNKLEYVLADTGKRYKPRGLDSGNVEHKKDGCEGLRVRPLYI